MFGQEITTSVYSKFHVGVSSERREAEVKRLNQTYLDVVASKKTLNDSLDYMVDTESYRWICKATYSLSPKPLRSQRSFVEEDGTEKTTVQDSVKCFWAAMFVLTL